MVLIVLALSDGTQALIGSISGVAAFVTAIVGYLIYKDNKETRQGKKDINLLTAGQASLNAALVRADLENTILRNRVDEAEARIEVLETENAQLRAQVGHLEEQLRRSV